MNEMYDAFEMCKSIKCFCCFFPRTFRVLTSHTKIYAFWNVELLREFMSYLYLWRNDNMRFADFDFCYLRLIRSNIYFSTNIVTRSKNQNNVIVTLENGPLQCWVTQANPTKNFPPFIRFMKFNWMEKCADKESFQFLFTMETALNKDEKRKNFLNKN